jgi:mannose-6-phosphate isomerase-like protein (cupin superfamily)
MPFLRKRSKGPAVRLFDFLFVAVAMTLPRPMARTQTVQQWFKQYNEYPPNTVLGVDINRFVGNPFLHHPNISHDAIVVRDILTHGDPYKPGDAGAVLEYRKSLAVGTLWAKNATPLVELTDEIVLYIEDGSGYLDNGTEYWTLREGIMALIPPNSKHRIVNTGDEPLNMLLLTWQNPKGVTPRTNILVRDANAIPIRDKNSHWSYLSKNIFNPADGLDPGESFYVSYLPPMTITAPHSHGAHHEECWVKLPPDSSFLFLGSEVRKMPPNTAFLVPPNDEIGHSVINLSKDRRQAWFVFNRFHENKYPPAELPFVNPKPLRDLR